MITLIVFFISSKYNKDAGMLYLGTFIIDISIIDGIVNLIKG